MTGLRIAAGMAGLALLVACAEPAQLQDTAGFDGPPVPPPEGDTCGAGPYAELVGMDARALERVTILRQVRIIRPGDAVTMDMREERINFEVGADGRVARIFCA